MPIHYAPDQVRDRYAKALRLCSQEGELRLREGYYCLVHFHAYDIPLTPGLRQAAASPRRSYTRRATQPHMPRAGPQSAPEPPIPSIRTHGTGAASIGFLGAIPSPARSLSPPAARDCTGHDAALSSPPHGSRRVSTPWPHPAQTTSCRRPLVSDSKSQPKKT